MYLIAFILERSTGPWIKGPTSKGRGREGSGEKKEKKREGEGGVGKERREGREEKYKGREG